MDTGNAITTASIPDTIEPGNNTALPVSNLHMGKKLAVPTFMNKAQTRYVTVPKAMLIFAAKAFGDLE